MKKSGNGTERKWNEHAKRKEKRKKERKKERKKNNLQHINYTHAFVTNIDSHSLHH